MDETEIATAIDGRDLYHAATELAAIYRLELLPLLNELKRLYGPGGTVPENHLSELATQIEAQTQRYQIREEEVEVALALIKPDGFQTENVDGDVAYKTRTNPYPRQAGQCWQRGCYNCF